MGTRPQVKKDSKNCKSSTLKTHLVPWQAGSSAKNSSRSSCKLCLASCQVNKKIPCVSQVLKPTWKHRNLDKENKILLKVAKCSLKPKKRPAVTNQILKNWFKNPISTTLLSQIISQNWTVWIQIESKKATITSQQQQRALLEATRIAMAVYSLR